MSLSLRVFIGHWPVLCCSILGILAQMSEKMTGQKEAFGTSMAYEVCEFIKRQQVWRDGY